jgi:hypothetical protein
MKKNSIAIAIIFAVAFIVKAAEMDYDAIKQMNSSNELYTAYQLGLASDNPKRATGQVIGRLIQIGEFALAEDIAREHGFTRSLRKAMSAQGKRADVELEFLEMISNTELSDEVRQGAALELATMYKRRPHKISKEILERF